MQTVPLGHGMGEGLGLGDGIGLGEGLGGGDGGGGRQQHVVPIGAFGWQL